LFIEGSVYHQLMKPGGNIGVIRLVRSSWSVCWWNIVS